MLEFNISKKIGDFFLKLSFSVVNEFVVIFGPSAAGKTMTLQLLAGLIKPDKGYIKVNGKTYFDSEKKINLPVYYRRIGYVFQEYVLFPHLLVFENIAYGISRLPEEQIKENVQRMLRLLRLSDISERYPSEISGGQKQRVAIARALVTKPDLILMDEPFGALDYPVRSKLRFDLLSIIREFSSTILFVTHDIEEAYILGKKIAVINGGRLEQIGSRDEVFYRPKTRAVAKFFGTKNIFNGEVLKIDTFTKKMIVRAREFIFLLNCIEGMNTGDHIEFCIRPEEIIILRENRPIRDTLLDNIFSCKIVDVLEKGAEITLFARAGSRSYDFEINIPNYVYRDLDIFTGKEIEICLKRDSIWVIPSGMKSRV